MYEVYNRAIFHMSAHWDENQDGLLNMAEYKNYLIHVGDIPANTDENKVKQNMKKKNVKKVPDDVDDD